MWTSRFGDVVREVICLCGIVFLNGCTTGAYRPVAVPSVPQSSPIGVGLPAKLMIFGGTDHKVYLGCLNCSEYEADSVKNAYGTHGSAYSSESIFNHYSEYGSAYSNESACSEYASDPPVIVDQNGKYYGRLTLNRYQPEIGAGSGLMGWLSAVCHK